MRMKIPITGTVIQVNPCVIGAENDPIRPVEINLGNVSWTLIKLDLENEEMEIEVTPADRIGISDTEDRPTTPQEKAQFTDYAKDFSLERKTKQQLYTLSGSKKLVNQYRGVIE